MLETYRGKRVLVTGHTGFKGSWLTLWLDALGAEVTGLALEPDTDPAIFRDAGIETLCRSVIGDVRDLASVRKLVRDVRPHAVFHLAAQSLVRRSYEDPIDTLSTNVTGTAHVLEAIRLEHPSCAVVVVTSDKCYENREWEFGYREDDCLGGRDVYSASKGAAEIVAHSYRRSFELTLATARAGNVIGGGDWCKDRILPDTIRALSTQAPVPVRNPQSVRPWQHVLESLSGYLTLGAHLLEAAPARYCEAWNIGPLPESTSTVAHVVDLTISAWGSGRWEKVPTPGAPHEAGLLRLSIDKAVARLGWSPRWDLGTAIRKTVEWYLAHHRGASPPELRALTLQQIESYSNAMRR